MPALQEAHVQGLRDLLPLLHCRAHRGESAAARSAPYECQGLARAPGQDAANEAVKQVMSLIHCSCKRQSPSRALLPCLFPFAFLARTWHGKSLYLWYSFIHCFILMAHVPPPIAGWTSLGRSNCTGPNACCTRKVVMGCGSCGFQEAYESVQHEWCANNDHQAQRSVQNRDSPIYCERCKAIVSYRS